MFDPNSPQQQPQDGRENRHYFHFSDRRWERQWQPFQQESCQPASRFKRLLAYFINHALFVVTVFMTATVLQELGYLLGMIGYLAVQIYAIRQFGQTLGKHWLGLTVVGYPDGQPLDFIKYLLRECVDFIFFWVGFPIIVSAIVAFTNDDKRSLTDLIMSTKVVKVSA